MEEFERLLDGNKVWRDSVKSRDPGFFTRLSKQQSPAVLWIGCSDSRVSANQITNTDPGEIFVHRNVANLALKSDLNFQSVLTFAINHLGVRHIIVCGHYGCGGIQAASRRIPVEPCLESWLHHIRETESRHLTELMALSESERLDRLTELNIQHQVENLAEMEVVRAAWERGAELHIHGLVYSLENGELHQLKDVTPDIPQ